MKKLLTILTVGLLSVSLVACKSGKSDTTSTENKTTVSTANPNFSLTEVSLPQPSDLATLDYVGSEIAADNEILVNFVDGLYEQDVYGNYLPALAESYTTNEDKSVWTFKIKPGIKWYTANGEEYAEVTAHDFVTAAQYAAKFKVSSSWLFEEFIQNFAKYAAGEASESEFGVKALDDYTLEYTLVGPKPYFLSFTQYSVTYPINREFLLSRSGCSFEEPSLESCTFGSLELDSILYNGPYVLTANDSKSKIELTKNQNYWDKDKVHLDKITFLYDDGKDNKSVLKGFENGVYAQFALSPSWPDYADYLKKFEEYVNATPPNVSSFGINLTYNRHAFNNTSKNEAERENTAKALLNKDFRLAIQHSMDRVAYLSQSAPQEVAIQTLRNLNTFPEIVVNSKGETYGKLVEKAYQKLTGKEISLADGQDPFLNKDLALEHINKAKAAGINFPVTLDHVFINEGSEVYTNRARSIKESIEKNTDGQILVNIIGLPKDEVYRIAYRSHDPAEQDFDFNTFSGWGPDYSDPKTFADIYRSDINSAYLSKLGLYPEGENAQSDTVIKTIGLDKYTALVKEADKEVNDLDRRYELYAEAEAFFLSEGLYIPTSQNTRGYVVSKFVPFQAARQNRSLVGNSSYKFKNVKVQAEIVTKAEYEAAKAEWESKLAK